MPESELSLTPGQRAAVSAAGTSVLVSAAAGAGKTRVLTERVLSLVCDAPASGPNAGCDLDRVVVVTFTDAAATQMRTRIAEGLRRRLHESRRVARARTQLALLDLAQISTIHSFCNRLIREHFAAAAVDPAARLMDAEEAELLKLECLETLFVRLYDAGDDHGEAFCRLLDDYYLGEDTRLAAGVTAIYDFTRSLVEPDAWLTGAQAWVRVNNGGTSADLESAFVAELNDELAQQHENCRHTLEFIRQRWPDWAGYPIALKELESQLSRWLEHLAQCGGAEQIDAVLGSVAGHKFLRAPTVGKERDRAVKERIQELVKEAKDRFRHRLVDRWCRTTGPDRSAGLKAVEPTVVALCGLVKEFGDVYERAKQTRRLLDFADLERKALSVLSAEGNPRHPSQAALVLRNTYEHVLVDEFQDINPVQDAILRLVSREDDGERPANLFVVGDVKQSIYRFRLAEPEVFVERMSRFERGHARGRCYHLPENFRSAGGIIEVVNAVFERLMTPALGRIVYDDKARLRCARPAACFDGLGPPVELHLLPRQIAEDGEDEDSPPPIGDWEIIEREAQLIGRLIHRLVGLKDSVTGRALGFRDVVILLRSVRHRAPLMARRLARMNISVHGSASGAFFEAVEVQDLLSLLALLDNFRQDIPLAAVLRSPLVGEPLSDSDLVELRCRDRRVPFHEAALGYAEHGQDRALRERMSAILDRLRRWRRLALTTPPATFLWQLCENTGYLSYVAGLPGGAQRRANLLLLHERARRFEQSGGSCLHRFVAFLERLRDSQAEPGDAAPVAGSDDAVRIMSIHKAKGLEFPVVVLADTAKQFNFADARGPILFDRDRFIGAKVMDQTRMIEYPSVAHTLAAAHIEKQTRAEELRLLYVAMTRAQEKLILVGSMEPRRVEMATTGRDWPANGPLPASIVAGADRYLDWLLPALTAAGDGLVDWGEGRADANHGEPRALVRQYSEKEVASWEDPAVERERRAGQTRHYADLGPLPSGEPRSADGSEARAAMERVFFHYPMTDMTAVPAVIAASELKRRMDPPAEQPSAAPLLVPSSFRPREPRFCRSGPPADLAARKGTATHALLEHLDLATSPDAVAVRQQLHRLVHETCPTALTGEEAELIDLDSVVWFLDTELGRRMRRERLRCRRELMFVSREPVEQYDAHLRGYDAGDCVMIRGVIDAVLENPAGLELIDYKTDDLASDQAATRAAYYRTQVTLYAAAARRLFRRPVTDVWLVFLTPRLVVRVEVSGGA